MAWRRAVPSIVITAALVAACAPAEDGASGRATTSSNAGAAQARRQLKALTAVAPDAMTGYSRERFGTRWKDTDHNGCDTRNDILSRDLTGVRKRGRCVVIAGTLHDPYTGTDVTFAKARAAQVQIDHVIPLALAWRTGADHWDEAKRTELANDRDNLLAVWGKPNQQKSDKGPAEWRPRRQFQCAYAVRFVGVAAEYRLGVTRPDRAALTDMLDRC